MPSGENDDGARLPWHRVALYGLPNGITSVAALPLALFVPAFYAQDLGLSLAAVGAAIAASRLLDVVTDPWIGSWSDRVRSRIGRRKPFLLAGTPLLALAVWQVFVPGPGAGIAHLAIWCCLLYLGFTLVDLPYRAWGAELSTDYHERSRIAAWREGMGAAGQVGLLAVLVLAGARGLDAGADTLRAIATVVVVALPILVLAAATGVPEPPAAAAPVTALGRRRAIALVLRNPAFRRMLGAVLLFVSGVVVQGTLHRLVLIHVLEAPELFPRMILMENVATLLAVPIWQAVGQRLGKHRAASLAALWLAAFSLPLPLFGVGDGTAFVAVVVLRGSSFASILFLANAMAADVVDLDEVESGRQRTGVFFAVWGMATKLSVAIGVVLATSLPAAFGFSPGEGELAAPPVRTALMGIYGWLPAVMMGVGAAFLWRFPIDARRQRALRATLDQRALDA